MELVVMCKFEHYIQELMFLQNYVYLNKTRFSKYNINLNQLVFSLCKLYFNKINYNGILACPQVQCSHICSQNGILAAQPQFQAVLDSWIKWIYVLQYKKVYLTEQKLVSILQSLYNQQRCNFKQGFLTGLGVKRKEHYSFFPAMKSVALAVPHSGILRNRKPTPEAWNLLGVHLFT